MLEITYKNLKKLKKLTEKEKTGYYASVLKYFNFPYQATDINTVGSEILAHYSELCIENVPGQYNDEVLPSLGLIRVSAESMRDSDTGLVILGHEIGHILFSKLRDKKLSNQSTRHYEDIKSCLIKKHSGKIQYANEDFSDLVAGVMTEGLGGNLCFDAINIADPLKENPLDDHSPDYFRILHIKSVQAKGIPPLCQQSLDALGSKIKFDSCWSSK